MSARESPPFRADHVGSLLRPPELLRAGRQFADGTISFGRLRAVEDDAIRAAIHRQEDLGLSAVTDGELRRTSRPMDVGDHFQFLAREVHKGTPKLTIPSPNQRYLQGDRRLVDTQAYADMEGLLCDLADAYVEQVWMLYGLGCRYLQLDDTSLVCMADASQADEIARRRGDLESRHLVYVKTLCRVLAAKPADMVVSLHMCRGDFGTSWVAERGYDHVAEAIFDQLDVDGFFMELDDERPGGFESLRLLPKGKVAVLGLVTSKRGDLERREDLERRIEQASRYADIDQLCLSPQCGFSSSREGNDLSPDQQWAKLQLVVETAEAVWGSAH
jgi:5-methyltetrahydropteroyltriglutamate--homocysteine methyltransferase